MPHGKKYGGRIKGTPNKITATLREMIEGALEDAGGREYLHRQAALEPRAFLALVGRLIPSQVNARVSSDTPIEIRVVTGFDDGPHER